MECSNVQLSTPCPLLDRQRGSVQVEVRRSTVCGNGASFRRRAPAPQVHQEPLTLLRPAAIIGCGKDASQYSSIRQLSLVLGSASASDCRISSLSNKHLPVGEHYNIYDVSTNLSIRDFIAPASARNQKLKCHHRDHNASS